MYAEMRQVLGSNDVAALMQVAVLTGSVLFFPLGRELGYPFQLSPLSVLLLGYGSLVAVCLLGVRASRDRLVRRLLWSLALVIPGGVVLGWVILRATDVFYTSESLYQLSAVFLFFCMTSAALERRAAVGTPADVLARSSSSTAVVTFLIFWTLTALKLQTAAVAFIMLGGVLLSLTLIFRVPGAIVPIWRRRGRRAEGGTANSRR
jgi:hypothetical protein